MAVAYFMIRAARAIKGIGSADLYESYQVVRDLYSDVSTWTGLTVANLLDEDFSEKVENLHSVLEIRSLANHLSLADVLAEEGLKPSAVVGFSLGLISGSCLSGALGRRDAFEMLWERRYVHDDSASAAGQAVAMCRIGPDDDPDLLCESWPGVYPATYFGVTRDGDSQYLLVAGYTEALNQLAASEPDAVLKVFPETSAAHTPLRQRECDFVRSYLADVCFADPVIPVIGCMDPGALRTALDVRAAIWENHVRPVKVSYGMAELAARGIKLCIALGPTQVEGLMSFPCPVIRIEKPADVASALAKVGELGI